jgi:hypothetical protein
MLLNFKKWWATTTNTEKSALLTLSGIMAAILLFNLGIIIGRTVF